MHHDRYTARRIAREHKGDLLKECCERCGGKDFLELHHPDYSEPLEVETLCYLCHRDLHSEMRFIDNLLKNSGRKIVVRDFLNIELIS